MKSFLNLITALCFVCSANAQNTVLPPTDKSPMDMSYYPANYPVLKIQNKVTEPLVARVVYSRPEKAGRTIFGGLVEYGKIWRLGANEATELDLFKNVRIGGKKVAKGRYTLYALVNEDTWTLILNRETDTWGAFNYDPKKDVVRVDVPVQKADIAIESLSMGFEKISGGMNLVIGWDLVKVSLPVLFY